MKQTAMQVMYDELMANEYTIPLELIVKCKELIAMEKEQIIDAFKKGIEYWNGDEWKLIDINSIYNQTYKLE